ncbi:sulfatase-like hydrolase/transferase [Tamlana sp. 2201CG12-4]|uniref:sulfatase-like hydrolase/transferase n=1 Tax=Tamlana sp. 2201CG12-4 TaxID=3112582 RepID=UPI002DB86301|nr:sulfatase-like hydrolase/transferase [Tamlana sp. 2201CG12-4]MEC3908662.1 sulfatase-like hydrolase/transferase [Tamlana sp. 2201CG12-4]
MKIKHVMVLGLWILGANLFAQIRPKQEKPNIILIMADDLGYAGLSSFGGIGIKTPELDHLVENGIKCTSFYSNAPVCTPTRVALLTGRYQQRVGLDHLYYPCIDGDGLDPKKHIVLASQLKKAGYYTGVFGKWHLGDEEKYRPKSHGFDEFTGFLDGNIDFISHHNTRSKEDWWIDHKLKNEEGYVTTLLNNAAVNFIENNHKAPFFLYLPHAAVHVPMQGPDDPALRTNEYWQYRVDKKMTDEVYMRRYSDMMTSVDKGVGRIMATLKKYNIEENTLIIFISDNGGEERGVTAGNVNGGLRGYKGTMYEGGIKVPALFYWKETLKPGLVNKDVMLSMDIFPTILHLAGIKEDKTLKPDGVNLWRSLKKGKNIKKRDLFWMHKERVVMRSKNLKLIIQNSDVELYDLSKDPKELVDLSENIAYKKDLDEMLIKSKNWHKETAIGFPLERVLGKDLKIPWPCGRNLEEYNKNIKAIPSYNLE